MVKKLFNFFKPPDNWRIYTNVLIAVIVGLAAYLVHVSKATSYLSDDPKTCVNCHIMAPQYATYAHSSHREWANCNDCHVPHKWTDKIVRKVQASKEIFAFLMGNISTEEKFYARRKHLAIREWQRMKENDSQECRNCHNFDFMDFSEQGPRSVKQHSTALANGDKTCVDCHKGIAHQLPDMSDVPGW